jgi:hypothetical protein
MRIRIDPADKAFSLWVRTRDKWTCQRCGKRYEPPTQALHCSHFQGRGKEATRFDPANADAMCYGCHRYLTAHPGEHYAWQVARKGQKAVDALVLLSNTYAKKDRKAEELYWKQRLRDDYGI